MPLEKVIVAVVSGFAANFGGVEVWSSCVQKKPEWKTPTCPKLTFLNHTFVSIAISVRVASEDAVATVMCILTMIQ